MAKNKKTIPPPKAEDLVNLFGHLGILDEEIFQTKTYLSPQALRAGAEWSFSIRDGLLDFYVDKKGNLVGTHCTSAQGWKKYRGPKTIKKFKII